MLKVRLKDIAAKADVSLGTVDRVIHNRGRVSEVTRQKVLAIAKEIGYTKNPHATILAQQNVHQRIGCIIPERGRSPYWDQVHSGIAAARKEFYSSNLRVDLLEFPLHNNLKFRQVLQSLEEEHFDGIIVAPIFHREWTTCEISVPFVAINTLVADHDNLISFVGPDSFQSGRLAGRLMCERITSPGSILVLPLEKDYGNADHLIAKEEGLREYCSEYAPHVSIIVHEFENYDDRTELCRFISKTLDSSPNIKAIYTGTCRIHEVASCLEEIGAHSLLTCGYDPIPPNIAHLKKGHIDFLIGQNAPLMGYYGLRVLYQHLILKENTPKYRHVPLDVILPENAMYHNNGQSSWPLSERLFSMTPLVNHL